MNGVLPPQNIPKAVFDKFFGQVQSDGSQAPEDGVLLHAPRRKWLPAASLTVLGVAPDATACGHYRVKYPLMCLAEQGAQVEVRVASREIPLQSFLQANVIYLSRAYTDGFRRHVRAIARLTGATVVYDLDDCLHRVARTNPCFSAYDPKTPAGEAALTSIDRFLGSVDGVVFSTRELQAYYRRQAPHSHVLLNGLDLTLGERDWDDEAPAYDWRVAAAEQGCAPDADSLLFGWSGGSSHYEDLSELGDAVARILTRTRNTFFGIFTSSHQAYHFCVERWGLPLSRVVYLPRTSFQQYPRVLSAFDLALAPLKNTIFNRSKSCLRLLEAGAWSVPYVASKVAPYYRFHLETNGQGGLIAEEPPAFVRQAVRLLQDKDLRLQKGFFIKQYVRQTYDLRRTMAALPYALKAFHEGKNSQDVVTRKPSLLAVQDAFFGLPRVNFPVAPDDPCPCGSGSSYRGCPRRCAPAFGRLPREEQPLGG